jgi:hypothetical protein
MRTHLQLPTGSRTPSRHLLLARVILVCVCQLLIWMIFSARIAFTGEFGLELAESRDLATLLFGVLGVGLLSLVLPGSLDRVAQSASWMLFITLVIPSWVMIYALGLEGAFGGYITSVILPVVALGVWARSASQLQQGPFVDRDIRLLGAVSVGLLIMLFLFTPLSLPQNITLDAVYDRRLDFRERGGSLANYLHVTSEHAIAPLSVAIAMVSGRRFWLIIAGSATVGAFLSHGSKQCLMVPIAIAGMALVGRRFGNRAEPLLAAGAIAILLVGLIDLPEIDLYTVRRIFCAPPYIVASYIDWFDVNGPLYGRDIGVLSRVIFGIEPETTASLVVGRQVMMQPELNANTNCFAFGFAELGAIGPWVILAVVVAYLKVLESVCSVSPAGFPALIGLQVAVVLSEQSLHTAILSGGLAATVGCCWVLTRGSRARAGFAVRARRIRQSTWTSTRFVDTPDRQDCPCQKERVSCPRCERIRVNSVSPPSAWCCRRA